MPGSVVSGPRKAVPVGTGPRTSDRAFRSPARWQSGHAADCKSAYAGSIPTLASMRVAGFRLYIASFAGTPDAASQSIADLQSRGTSSLPVPPFAAHVERAQAAGSLRHSPLLDVEPLLV